MPRVKRSRPRAQEAPQGPRAGQGLLGPQELNYTYAKEQVERSLAYAYRDRKVRKREFRKLWIMRINAGARANGLSYNQFIAGLKAAEHRARPEGARRSRGHRPGEVRRDRRAGQVGARRREITRAGGDLPPAGRATATAARRSTRTSVAGSRKTRGSATSLPTSLGLSAAAARRRCTTSCSPARRRGTTSAPRSSEHARVPRALDRASRTCRRTRCSARGRCCPGFLSLADGRPFDLLELGPSAGLNLVWDRYRYRYSTGEWGTGALELTGDDRVPPPAELSRAACQVARRRGIDLNPVDVTTEHGARLLQSFVWADQADAARAAAPRDRDRARRPARADARRLRRVAAGAARRPRRRARSSSSSRPRRRCTSTTARCERCARRCTGGARASRSSS